MDFRDRHVVVTGGTGALGTAVVSALVGAGAVCHVPYIHAAEAERFPLRDHAQVRLVADVELTDEAAVATLYGGVPKLWASIHLAGGFAMAPVAETTKSDSDAAGRHEFRHRVPVLPRRGQRHDPRRRGGRIVNVATRPALEWRTGAGMVAYTASKAAVAALTVALGRGGREGRHSGECGRALDHGHAGQPQSHAESRPRRLAEGRGGRGDDPVPGLAGKQGHPRRGGAGVWASPDRKRSPDRAARSTRGRA